MQARYDVFAGNTEFYNDPRYRAANLAFYSAIHLLEQCGMSYDQAIDWVSNWGCQENGEEE